MIKETLLANNESAQINATQEPTQATVVPKKKYVKPVLSEPEGLLETTKFFFQAANVGSDLSNDRKHQNSN